MLERILTLATTICLFCIIADGVIDFFAKNAAPRQDAIVATYRPPTPPATHITKPETPQNQPAQPAAPEPNKTGINITPHTYASQSRTVI